MEYQGRLKEMKQSPLYQSGEPFTATDMSKVFGITRVATSAMLNRMAQEGHLTINRGKNINHFAKPPTTNIDLMRQPWRKVSNKTMRIKQRQFGVQI